MLDLTTKPEKSSPENGAEPRGGGQPLRRSLADIAEGFYSDELIQEYLQSLAGASKKVRVQCKHCNKISYADVPDDPKRAEAFLKIAEFLEGKASTVDTELGGVTIVVERTWPVENPPHPD